MVSIGGSIENDESVWRTALREVKEEIGTLSLGIIYVAPVFVGNFIYNQYIIFSYKNYMKSLLITMISLYYG